MYFNNSCMVLEEILLTSLISKVDYMLRFILPIDIEKA
jgi:hypothetical protein